MDYSRLSPTTVGLICILLIVFGVYLGWINMKKIVEGRKDDPFPANKYIAIPVALMILAAAVLQLIELWK